MQNKESKKKLPKLLSCPFCGGEAHVYRSESKILGETFYAIDCDSNECIVHTMVADYSTEKEAIEHWNTRKPMERIVERLEEVVAKRIAWIGMPDSYCDAIDKAIDIVKAGGTDAE